MGAGFGTAVVSIRCSDDLREVTVKCRCRDGGGRARGLLDCLVLTSDSQPFGFGTDLLRRRGGGPYSPASSLHKPTMRLATEPLATEPLAIEPLEIERICSGLAGWASQVGPRRFALPPVRTRSARYDRPKPTGCQATPQRTTASQAEGFRRVTVGSGCGPAPQSVQANRHCARHTRVLSPLVLIGFHTQRGAGQGFLRG